eukprot:EC816650.1.p3 GENE.EC816650.1~~EC816650.1.p3  ORF type:complete len:142 (-),score=13.70 EC816650.1:9-434(-)
MDRHAHDSTSREIVRLVVLVDRPEQALRIARFVLDDAAAPYALPLVAAGRVLSHAVCIRHGAIDNFRLHWLCRRFSRCIHRWHRRERLRCIWFTATLLFFAPLGSNLPCALKAQLLFGFVALFKKHFDNAFILGVWVMRPV